MTTIFRKYILGALIIALAIAALPLISAYAAGSNDTATPPVPATPRNPALVNVRLEFAFARQQYNVQRIGLAIDNSDILFKRIQTLLDKAIKNGKDASAVQTAFGAYKVAFENGKPFYEQAKTIAVAHAGFDVNGKVTDPQQAKTTVKSLAEALKPYRATVAEAFKTLRETIKAFRAANPRPTRTPTAP